MKVTGKITKVLDTQKGTTSAGKNWQKLTLLLVVIIVFSYKYWGVVYESVLVQSY